LSDPQAALAYLAANTVKMLFLETCVSFGEAAEINLTSEKQHNPTQAFSGIGCRPTRAWLFRELKKLFEFVYVPVTQPRHAEFPLDWTAAEKHKASFQRAVFIASRQPLHNDLLSTTLLQQQLPQK
jgi:hypothetical protein